MSSTSLYSEPTSDSDGSELNYYWKYKIDAESDSEQNKQPSFIDNRKIQ